MDLIMVAWQPSDLTEGRVLVQPANFGIMGGAIYQDWTPTFVPPPDYNPHIAQSNNLEPFPEMVKVTDLAQYQAVSQSGLRQLSQIKPATFVPAGTASTVVN